MHQFNAMQCSVSLKCRFNNLKMSLYWNVSKVSCSSYWCRRQGPGLVIVAAQLLAENANVSHSQLLLEGGRRSNIFLKHRICDSLAHSIWGLIYIHCSSLKLRYFKCHYGKTCKGGIFFSTTISSRYFSEGSHQNINCKSIKDWEVFPLFVS